MAVVEQDRESVTAGEGEKPASLRRNRDFLLLWGGQVVSAVGSQVSQLAFPLLILALTGSPAQAGFLGAMRGLAYVLFGLPAGAYVDRWDRKRVMIVSDTVRALALGSIPVALAFGRLTLVQLYLVTFLEGTFFIFFGLAESACLPRIARKEQLPAAVAANEFTYSFSSLIGPSIGGALYGLGRAFPFVADAISYLASVIAVLFMRGVGKSGSREVERGADALGTQAKPRRLRDEITEGMRWLWHQPVVRFLCTVNGGVNLLYGGWTLLLISLAQRQGASAFAIGLIFATGGIGTLIGTALAAPIQKRFTVGQIIVWIAWIFAITWPPYAWAPNIAWIGIVNAIGFVFVPIYVTTHFSYRLVLIPDALQGRGNSVFRLVTFGTGMIGFALMGALLQWVGPIGTVYISSVPAFALAIATMLNPQVRHAGRIADIETTAAVH
jgi:predicted MFS family arabinose efflux permease